MKKKRLAAIALSLCLLLAEVPAVGGLTARASGSAVTYARKNPEVAILNAYSGNNSGFYTKVQNDSRFNYAEQVPGLGYSKKISKDSTITYSEFGSTVLNSLAETFPYQMQASYSATFDNKNGHKHYAGMITIDTSYISSGMYINGSQISLPSGWNGIKSKTTRQGNDKFTTYYASGGDSGLTLSYWNSLRLYSGLTSKVYECTCGGDAYNHTILFRDTVAPEITKVRILDASGNEKTEFRGGDKVILKLTGSEPLRFAADAVPAKDVCIGLGVDGGNSQTEELIAKLTSLITVSDGLYYANGVSHSYDVSEMTFELTLPAGTNKKIVRIDLSPAASNLTSDQVAFYDAGGNIELRQVKGSESFTVDKTTSDGIGFTRARSYVTDLAGNSFASSANVKCEFVVDSEAPYIAEIDASATTYNSAVKDALGKSGMAPTDPLYSDASDTSLGVGDYISFQIYMNELITPNLDAAGRYSAAYTGATLQTNLIDKNGNPVTKACSYAFTTTAPSTELGWGSSNGKVTMLSFDPIKIEDGMTISDGGTEIKVLSVAFAVAPTDKALNAYTGSTNKLAVSQKYQLDVVAPIISDGSIVSASYGGNGYVYQFTVSDSSGVSGLNGAFSWYSDSTTAPYEYALTANMDMPTAWTQASMRTTNYFTQTGAAQYLHIRPIAGQQYDIHNSYLSFSVSDYAGNRKDEAVNLGSGIVFDTIAPTVTKGTASRNYDNAAAQGTLTVTVNITDSGTAINNVSDANRPMYLFADAGTVISAESGDWKLLEGPIDGTNCTFILNEKVAKGVHFNKELYVKVGDAYGNNSGAIDLGSYNYNLEAVEYSLAYSSAFSDTADIYVSELESSATLFFYIPIDDATCYGRKVTSAQVDGNIFYGGWKIYTLDKSSGGWVFTEPTELSSIWPYSPFNHDYTDILSVHVLAGTSDAVNDTGATLTFTGAASEETVRLFILQNNGAKGRAGDYQFDRILGNYLDINLTEISGEEINKYIWNNEWNTDNGFVMDSLAGVQFSYSISAKDGYAWILDDIDISSSKVVVYRGSLDTSELIAEVPLGNSMSGIVTLPDVDYGTGVVYVQLLIKRIDTGDYFGDNYERESTSFFSAFVDDTVASDAFELSHVIHTFEYSDGYSVIGTVIAEEFGLEPEELFIDLPVDKAPYRVDENADAPSPITVPYYHYDAYNDWDSAVYFSFTSDEPSAEDITYGMGVSKYAGMSVMQAWNITSGSDTVDLTKYFANNNSFTKSPLTPGGNLRLKIADDADSAKALNSKGTLGVIKNTVNFIAVRTVYANGRTSGVKYYAFYPAEGDMQHSINIFADENNVTDYYASVGSDVHYDVAFANPGERTVYANCQANGGVVTTARSEFILQDSGIYRYSVNPDDEFISFFVKDSYGIYVPIAQDSGHRNDKKAPEIAVRNQITVDGDGTFKASFTIYDDSFAQRDSWNRYPLNPTLHFSFDDTYSAILGIEPDSGLDVQLNLQNWYDTKGPNYEEGLTAASRKYSLWQTDGADNTGITDVYARYDDSSYQIIVTVEGIIHPGIDEAHKTDVTLKLSASDALGNRSNAVSSTAAGAFGKEPYVTNAEYKEISSTTWDNALFLTFSAPVQPAESWINRSISGFQTTWYDAFPITNDGDWEITFTDIFGNTYTRTITIPSGTFGDFGFDLYISTLEPTAGDVTISAATDDGKDCFMSFSYDPVTKRSTYGGYVNGDDASLYAEPAKTRIVAYEGCYGFFRFDSSHDGEYITNPYLADCTFIYLDNVAKNAPAAQLSFYFEEYGNSFTPAELRSEFPGGVTTTDFVRVSYDTARHVTPDGEAEHTFTYGGGSICTFSYTDDFGNEADVTVDLADYGITLGTPPEPYRDTETPVVNVDIYARHSGAYKKAEFFSVTDDDGAVGKAFTDASYVQDYSLTLTVTDYSAYRILLLSSEPDSSLGYTSASTFTNEYVTLSGNTIHIGKDYRTLGADFWVAVVDNAKAETGAGADNYCAFKVTQTRLAKWFDNREPTIEDMKEVADTLYQHTLYLKVGDKADDGADTPVDTLNVIGSTIRRNTATSGVYSSENYPFCITFNTNSGVPATVTDAAGNSSLSELTPLTEIDDSAPVLTVEWAPGLTVETDGLEEIDETQPTNGPVNTEVTAHIYSDKPIDITDGATKLEYLDYSGEYVALPQDGTYYGITWDETSQRITVTFTDEASCGETIKATVYAPNGQTAETYLLLPYDAIDMTAPDCYADIEPLRHYASSDKPYALRYTLYFSESLYVGSDGTLYDRYNPYSFTLSGKSKTDVTLTDLAGNVSVYSFDTETDEPTGLVPDCTAPVITFVDPASGDLSSRSASSGVVTATVRSNEDCILHYYAGDISLTAGVNTDITFSSNGTRTLFFVDAADNMTEITVTVSTIDNVIPVISMASTTVKVTEGCTATELKDLLESGVTASDNSGTAQLTFDSSVNLNVPGVYTVEITAKDPSGNIATAKRFVKVISKAQPVICIDGERLESSGVICIAPGEHTLTVSNLSEPGEPYQVTIARGIFYDGQIKYLGSQIDVDPNGHFTVSSVGFYTFYLQTQSRQSLRCLIDVES